MRLTFVISSLLRGGSERVLSTIANYWAEKGWKICVITIARENERPSYKLHRTITHWPLNLAKESNNFIEAVLNNLRRLSALHSAIKTSEPHAIISFGDEINILTLMATVGLDLPVIISERTDPHIYSMRRPWQELRSSLYPRAAYLVVQSESIRRYFSADVQKRTRVIPNPVVLDSEAVGHVQRKDGNAKQVVIGMGRLTEEKGFDLLIQAFAKAAPNHPRWLLEIWGEGPLRQPLVSLADKLGMHNRVQLPGVTQQPLEKMRHADLFVLSSRYEGFPNVLCEAMACGLPVLSFDCPSGPRQIINNGFDGVLVPAGDVDQLASAMDWLMSDAGERNRLANNAPNVLMRFGLERVMGMWEELIRDVVRQPRRSSRPSCERWTM